MGIEDLQAAELIRLVRFAAVAMTVLNARLFTLLSMLLTATAFGYAMYQPDVIRLAAACAFALLVFWPVQRMERDRLRVPPAPAERPSEGGAS